jgi:hypothetical protein
VRKGCQLYELLLMPCAAVQQLPHVRRGACDWTVGGAGGRDAVVSFCDYRWQCSLSKKLITYYLGSCELFFKNQIEHIFQILHQALMKKTNFCETKWSVL